MDYIIRTIRRDDAAVKDMLYTTDSKDDARQLARVVAVAAFPDAHLRWSGDCVMAFRDGEHIGDCAVERAEGE